MPMATAVLKLPLLVSSRMAVVMTRVLNWMLPPTSETAPTSAMDRPKPRRMTLMNSTAHSRNRSPSCFGRLRCRPLAVSVSMGAFPPAIDAARPVMIGVIRMTCAMTITCTVNRRCRLPNGPMDRNSRKTTRPATTGGRLMRVFVMRSSAPLPRKDDRPRKTPNGSPMRAEIPVLNRDMMRVVRMICRSSASPLRMRWNASRMTSIQFTSAGRAVLHILRCRISR